METKTRWDNSSPLGQELKLLHVVAVSLCLAACQTVPPPNLTPIQRVIYDESIRADIDPAIVLGVAKIESGFRPNVVSEGNYGLMQIKPATARSMGHRGAANSLLQAETNVFYGIRYLKHCYGIWGEWKRALGCYNGAAVANSAYSRRVMKEADKFR